MKRLAGKLASLARGTTSWDLAALGLMCVSLVGTGAYVWHNSPEKQRERRAMGPVRTVEEWRSYAAIGQRTETPDAKTTIVVFMDYQCPGCRAFHESIETLTRDNGTAVVVYRHYPLTSIHPHARNAAIAAECGARQGRFWELSRVMFAQQDSIGVKSWSAFADGAGIPNAAAFSRCMSDSAAAVVVDADVRDGNALGLPGTPSFLVNGALYTGSRPLVQLRELVADARP